MIDKRKIENEGWIAAKSGKACSSNPYTGEAHYYWDYGYTEYLLALANYG